MKQVKYHLPEKCEIYIKSEGCNSIERISSKELENIISSDYDKSKSILIRVIGGNWENVSLNEIQI